MEKKELEKQIDKIIDEVDNITNELLSNQEISAYKSYLLDLKLHILEGHYDELIKAIKNITEKEDKKYNAFNNLVLLGLLSSFIAVFVNPYIFLVLIYATIYGCRRTDAIDEERKKEIKSFEKDVKDVKSIFQCSYALIKTKSNIVIDDDRTILGNEEIKNIDLANKYIDMVLNGEAIPLISPSVQATVIRLLQSDLGTEENDIEELLMMAFEKTTNEMVRLDDFSLKRTNGCNYD